MSDPTNLSQKFAALQKIMTDQHQALMDEITALRGTGGPETTIRSLNQSLWSLAGTAPGASLLQLLDEITALRGTGGPETTIRSINQSLWNLAGTAPGASLLQLKTAIESLDSGISSVASNTSGVASNTSTLSATKDLIDRLLQQFDTAIVTPTMKDLLLLVKDGVDAIEANTGAIAADTGVIVTNTGTIATNTGTIAGNTGTIAGNTGNPLNTLPPGVCASPFTNSGIERISINAFFVEPSTLATWPSTVPAGFDITTESGGIATGQTKVVCSDWSQYRIYVASSAQMFSLDFITLQKLNTNEWITVSGSHTFEFSVTGQNSLKVYICPIEDPNVLGGCAGGQSDPIVAAAWTQWGTSRTFNPAIYNGGITWTQNVDIVPFTGVLNGQTNTQHMTVFAIVDTPTSTPQVCVKWKLRDAPSFQNTLHLREYILPGDPNAVYPDRWREGSGGRLIAQYEWFTAEGMTTVNVTCNTPGVPVCVAYALSYSGPGVVSPDVTITLLP